ncbi:LytR/AlgR family response regulator transcription factor [Burkholderiaceae bacterium UC74_6]
MRTLTAPTAVVAEDEETLRHELVEQLSRLWPELSVVGEAADGIQALQLVEQHQPDVLFLDIQMPGATGLEVARQVGGRSHVVFLTAYDQYAVAAFDQGAVDYVLKPLQTARFFTAISRVKQRLAGPVAEYATHVGHAIEQLSEGPSQGTAPVSNAGRAPLRWINASVGQTLKLITVDEVLYFQSDNKYTRVATREGEALIRKPLKELVEELDANQFWQIHRSTLVNAMAIAAVTRDFRGRMQLKLKERNETLLVAESYAHLFRQM